MNPYDSTENRKKILAMQLEVNAASQAASSASRSGSADADALWQTWRDLNTEIQQYIETLKRG
jgi:cytochrome c556